MQTGDLAGKLIEREHFIDHLRVIAIICVVLCHAVTAVYPDSVEFLGAVSDPSNLFRICAFTVGRTFGVPFFLLISGYLLLDRRYDEEGMKRFYAGKWLQLIICTVVWIVIYDLYLVFYARLELSAGTIVRDVLFLHRVETGHFWYMPMIIGFYALIPFLANAFRSSGQSLKYLWIPAGVAFAVVSVIPFISEILQAYGGSALDPQISAGFTGGMYGLWLIAGLMVKKGFLRNIKTAMLVASAAVCIAVILVVSWRFYRDTYGLWYDSPFVFVAGLFLFEAVRRLKLRGRPCIVFLARFSFSVYLIHYLILLFRPVRALAAHFRHPVQVILLELIMVAGGYALAWLISRIPKVGRYILYVK